MRSFSRSMPERFFRGEKLLLVSASMSDDDAKLTKVPPAPLTRAELDADVSCGDASCTVVHHSYEITTPCCNSRTVMVAYTPKEGVLSIGCDECERGIVRVLVATGPAASKVH